MSIKNIPGKWLLLLSLVACTLAVLDATLAWQQRGEHSTPVIIEANCGDLDEHATTVGYHYAHPHRNP